MMKLKYKAPLLLLSITLAITALSAYFNYKSNSNLVRSAIQEELQKTSTLIMSNLKIEADQASELASFVVNLEPVQKMLRARERDQLIKFILPGFLIQNEKYGALGGQFQIPPATAYIRLTHLDKWGDDLSSYREMVLKANKEGKSLRGVEASAGGISIRAIDVVKDKDGISGSFEVGRSFEGALQNLKETAQFDSGAFVKEDVIEKLGNTTVRESADKIIGGYRNVTSTDWKKIRDVVTPELLDTITEVTYKVQTVHGELKGFVVVPLVDFSGSLIGSIVAIRSFHTYQLELQNILVRCILFALAQAIILSAAVLIIVNALFIRPLEEIDKKQQEILGEQVNSDISFLAGRDDEIGAIAKNVERIGKKFTSASKPQGE